MIPKSVPAVLLASAIALLGCREEAARSRALRDKAPPAADSASEPAASASAHADRLAAAEAMDPAPKPDTGSTGPNTFTDKVEDTSGLIDLRYRGPDDTALDSGMVAILFPRKYHDDEIRAGAEKGEWLALHADPGGPYRLSPARIRIERVFDPIADKDSAAPTGKLVKVLGAADPVELLVAKSELMRESIVDTSADLGASVQNAKTFRFRGMQYKLEYEYFPVKSSVGADTSWRLILSVNKEGREPTRLLLDDGIAYSVAKVLFVGDLDGDDRLDFLLSSRTDSGVETFTLYLSRPAGDRFLKAMGHLHTVAC